MNIHVTLNRNIKKPLYMQIYEAYRQAILLGQVKKDSKLLSIMQLKRTLCVSRNTVEMAYLQLLSEGYIYSRAGSGYYVAELEQFETKKRDCQDEDHEMKALPAFDSLHLKVPGAKYDFKPGSVDHEHFPFKKWDKLARSVMCKENHDVLTYSDPRGEYELRMQIAKYLESSRGVKAHPNQIVVGAGTQTLIQLLCILLKKEHPFRVAMEEPGFTAVRKAFEWNGAEMHPISLENGAIDIGVVHKKNQKLTAVYVTPSNQHPMGGLLNVSNRLKLVNWAKKNHTYIIEDDYDSEFRYDIHPVPTIHALDPSGHVIYLGTFSKTLFPAMHIGYVVLPEKLLEDFSSISGCYNQTASKVHQLTIAQFMKYGYYDQHIRKMRTLYGKKHLKIVSVIETVFGNTVQVVGDHAGVNLTLRINSPQSESELIERAKEKGVIVYPISYYYMDKAKACNEIFIGYGHMKESDIEEAVKLLGEAWMHKYKYDTRRISFVSMSDK